MKYGFYFDGTRCTGCKTCMLACKDYHDLPSDIAFRQVYEYGGGTWEKNADGLWIPDCFTYYVSAACNHCDDPACMGVCPTGAMHKEEHGLVCVDGDRCIGCGYCALSCPYRAPKVDRTVGHSVKCDGCVERIAVGKDPICVEACPLRALEFGNYADLVAAHEGVREVAPLPPASITNPNLLIKPSRFAKEPGSAEGHLANESELV